MNDKLRSVNTRFWDDTFISELSPNEKLLFLYLITNPLTNLLGIYEITMKRICFDTGLKTDIIRKGFERFGKVKKVFFVDNFIILPNWLKNQRLNTNMKIAVSKEFKSLPDKLKINILGNDSEGLLNGSEGFGMVRERLGKYEIEIEDEIESEKEKGNIKEIIKTKLSFYSNQIKNIEEKKLLKERYISLVGYLFGENAIGSPVEHILKLEKQLTFDEYKKLFSASNSKNMTVGELMDSWVNNPKYSKGKVSIYLTLNNWINRSDGKNVKLSPEKKWTETVKSGETLSLLEVINKIRK